MAEIQVVINKEKADCKRRVDAIKEQTAEIIKPSLSQQQYYHCMVEKYIKKVRITCAEFKKQFRFGAVRLCHNKLEVTLDVAFAEQRLGLP